MIVYFLGGFALGGVLAGWVGSVLGELRRVFMIHDSTA
jgi:hypothetical protein